MRICPPIDGRPYVSISSHASAIVSCDCRDSRVRAIAVPLAFSNSALEGGVFNRDLITARADTKALAADELSAEARMTNIPGNKYESWAMPKLTLFNSGANCCQRSRAIA